MVKEIKCIQYIIYLKSLGNGDLYKSYLSILIEEGNINGHFKV